MTRYRHITAAGNVCEDVLAMPLEVAIRGYACAPRDQLLQIGTWDDATTPRTADPVYFNTMTSAAGKPPHIHRGSDN